ncbi:hypothetical protein [Streptomyces cinereoruber]|uniref:hypothetical protein n=1 Tax=Streptomyces cinereoruber TaxID=67260 RepID=UPI003C2D5E39
MYDQERTKMNNLVTGDPVDVNARGNAMQAALKENRPFMLVHAFNGSYLRPVELTQDSHDQGIKLAATLDPATQEAQGHLWYLTPAGFFGQRPLYLLESAAGQTSPEPGAAGDTDTGSGDAPKPRRRRVTVHQDAPKSGADTLQVGLPDKVGEKWQGKNGATEDSQLWVVTVTPWGGITFVPIIHPDTILGFKNQEVTAGSEALLTYNLGGDFVGTITNTFYPRLPGEWDTPNHQVFS